MFTSSKHGGKLTHNSAEESLMVVVLACSFPTNSFELIKSKSDQWLNGLRITLKYTLLRGEMQVAFF